MDNIYVESNAHGGEADFLSKLYIEDEDNDVLMMLKQSPVPVVLYGSGDVARACYSYLKINDVEISAVMVDDDLYVLDSYWGDMLKKKTEIEQCYKQYTIVLGHCHYEQKTQLLLQPSVVAVVGIVGICYRQIRDIRLVRSFLTRNNLQLTQLYDELADELSKKNMVAFYNCKANNNLDCIISTFDYCRNIFDNDVIQLHNKEVYVDVGAYNGDTIELFLNSVDFKYKRIYGIEAIKENYTIMTQRLKNVDGLYMINTAAGKEKNTASFETESTDQSFLMAEKDNGMMLDVNVERLDDIIDVPPTVMKFNIFKGTYGALIGATHILQTYKPKLIISIGFDEVELLNITTLIKSIQPRYKFYLRFLSAMDARLYLYAV